MNLDTQINEFMQGLSGDGLRRADALWRRALQQKQQGLALLENDVLNACVQIILAPEVG